MKIIEKEIKISIDKSQEGTYFIVPFDVPENIYYFEITYKYDKYNFEKDIHGDYINNSNVVDIGLVDHEENLIGASGSNKDKIFMSDYLATDGYVPLHTQCGRWGILVGAYKILKDSLDITYQVKFFEKEMILLRGDMHTHTTSSDGVYTTDEIIHQAKINQLDFLFITNHNNFYNNALKDTYENITVLPGVEWTHYKAHIGLLGIRNPYEKRFLANSLEEAQKIVNNAKKKGSIIALNHPTCDFCPVEFGMDNFEYDLVEVWNQFMKASDMRAIAYWHSKLVEGKK